MKTKSMFNGSKAVVMHARGHWTLDIRQHEHALCLSVWVLALVVMMDGRLFLNSKSTFMYI